MSLHTLQNTLFKIYLNPGYRLAHQFDPDRFATRFGLSEEHAEIVRRLPLGDTQDFAHQLKAKQMAGLQTRLPTTHDWLHANRPRILREFEEISTLSRLAGPGALVDLFVTHVREWYDYADLPDALPEVARLEQLLTSARRYQDEVRQEGAKATAPYARPAGFAWDSLYWTRPRTVTSRFAVDALAVLLKKRTMENPGAPTWVVIAPSGAGRLPVVMRIAEPAHAVLTCMAEPTRARDLREHVARAGHTIDDNALRSLLGTLEKARVIGAHHEADRRGR